MGLYEEFETLRLGTPKVQEVLERYTREDVLDAKGKNEVELIRIRAQLDDATAERAATGQYADARWFAKAKLALRLKGQVAQVLNRRLAELRDEQKKQNVVASAARDQDREERFVDAARKVLPKDLYLAVWAEVDRMAAE
jgi:hypothetical protein